MQQIFHRYWVVQYVPFFLKNDCLHPESVIVVALKTTTIALFSSSVLGPPPEKYNHEGILKLNYNRILNVEFL